MNQNKQPPPGVLPPFTQVPVYSNSNSAPPPTSQVYQPTEETLALIRRAAEQSAEATGPRYAQEVTYHIDAPSHLNRNLQKAHKAKAAQKQQARRAISDGAITAKAKAAAVAVEDPKYRILVRYAIYKRGEDRLAVDVSLFIIHIFETYQLHFPTVETSSGRSWGVPP